MSLKPMTSYVSDGITRKIAQGSVELWLNDDRLDEEDSENDGWWDTRNSRFSRTNDDVLFWISFGARGPQPRLASMRKCVLGGDAARNTGSDVPFWLSFCDRGIQPLHRSGLSHSTPIGSSALKPPPSDWQTLGLLDDELVKLGIVGRSQFVSLRETVEAVGLELPHWGLLSSSWYVGVISSIVFFLWKSANHSNKPWSLRSSQPSHGSLTMCSPDGLVFKTSSMDITVTNFAILKGYMQ